MITNYRILNDNDLKQVSKIKHTFINCDGYFYGFHNTKQALIITNQQKAKEILKRAPNRKAEILKVIENNKTYILLNCENLASIKALCKRKNLKTARKIKRSLKIKDLLIK